MEKRALVAQARLRLELARIAEKDRKKDDRRKILIGATLMNLTQRDDVLKAQLTKWLDAYLTRPHDRALFGLEPLPESDDAPPGQPMHTRGNSAEGSMGASAN